MLSGDTLEAKEMNSIFIVAAVKYALLSRDAWLEAQCVDWLGANWYILNDSAQTEIRRSIEREYESQYEYVNQIWRGVRQIWIGK